MTGRATTSDIEPHDFEVFLTTLDGLDVPGYRAEIVQGSITLSPWPKGYYVKIAQSICEQLEPHLPESHLLTTSPALYVFPGDRRAYGPDVHAASGEAFTTAGSRLDGESLAFAAELASSPTRDDDLTEKVQVYGRAGVPVYLLLDMPEEEATVFWMPWPKGYQSRCTKPFGEKLHIPAPFDCELDTAGFRRP
ncbi:MULTISPECIES: Uma2 family endonuclease [unclassified Streptomyces]|uniref:Uma2 family endonuclease n=1 Tax=unclassified Streptomyces TaxID=2593676 RepID=UPI000DDB27F4|nr:MULTISPECIES: Uma2 family endonuclease [unclassified Streptomyces]QZZ29257.1 Uma2 family endonuclease [Streptomyces sp. ST1015]